MGRPLWAGPQGGWSQAVERKPRTIGELRASGYRVLSVKAEMRKNLRDVTFCLMVATALHSIAVGNLLPAWVKVVCVDINPSTVIKLADRGSFQTIGLVTDVEPFFRALVSEVERLEASCAPSPGLPAG